MTKDDVYRVLVSNILEVAYDLSEEDILPSHHLRDLGLNSIFRSEIIMMTLEALDVNIPLVHLSGARNLEELSQKIANFAAHH